MPSKKEALFLEGKVIALHNMGKVGEKWYVTVSVLNGMYRNQVMTELKREWRREGTFHRGVVGPLENLHFCIKLENLDTNSLEFMRRHLIKIQVLKHDIQLTVDNISGKLVDKRKVMGSMEFEDLSRLQVEQPNAHVFGAFYLRQGHEVDVHTMRHLTLSVTWNQAYKKFDASR